MKQSVLSLCVKEFIVGFLYSFVIVAPLQWLFVFVGLASEFDLKVAMIVCSIMPLLHILVILFHIELEDFDE